MHRKSPLKKNVKCTSDLSSLSNIEHFLPAEKIPFASINCNCFLAVHCISGCLLLLLLLVTAFDQSRGKTISLAFNSCFFLS